MYQCLRLFNGESLQILNGVFHLQYIAVLLLQNAFGLSWFLVK